MKRQGIIILTPEQQRTRELFEQRKAEALLRARAKQGGG